MSRVVDGDFNGHSEVEPFLRRSSISITILGISYSHSFDEVIVCGRFDIIMPGHQFASRKTTARGTALHTVWELVSADDVTWLHSSIA